MFNIIKRVYSKIPLSNKEILEIVNTRTVTWEKNEDPARPYHTEIEGHHLHLRINDFPDEPLYTLMRGEQELLDLNEFFDNWLCFS